MSDLKIDYQKSKNAQEAYSAVKAAITPDALKKYNVNPDFYYGENSIDAKGKGFDLKIYFYDQDLDLNLDLSFMFSPFKSKVLDLLASQIKRVV